MCRVQDCDEIVLGICVERKMSNVKMLRCICGSFGRIAGTVLHCKGVGNCAHIMFIFHICICVFVFPMFAYALHKSSDHGAGV